MLTFAQNHVKNKDVLHSIFGNKNQKVKKEYVFFKLIWLQAMVRQVLLVTSILSHNIFPILVMSNQKEDADFQMVVNKRVVSLLTMRKKGVNLALMIIGIPNLIKNNAKNCATYSKIALVSIPTIGTIAISKRRMFLDKAMMRV